MENMVKLLLTGDFRRWGVIQLHQYLRWFGDVKRVGIELETDILQHETIRSLETKGFKETRCSSGTELTYLFDVTSPSELYRDVHTVVRWLGKHKVSTLGGLHINVQVGTTFLKSQVAPCNLETPRYRYASRLASNLHWDVEYSEEEAEVSRLEFKGGSGFIEPVDLLTQILLFAAVTRKANSSDIKRLCTTFEKIRKSLPNGEFLIALKSVVDRNYLLQEYSYRR